MAQPTYCSEGCGSLAWCEFGTLDDPVHQFLCPKHFIIMAGAIMLSAPADLMAEAGFPMGDPEEGVIAMTKGGRSRKPRPDRVAMDNPLRPVVEDPPAEEEEGGGEDATGS